MLAVGATGSVAAGAPATHKAAKAHHPRRRRRLRSAVGGIPDRKIGIQLWNFAAYVGFGTDAATQARLEEVLRRLSEMGYRNVEPFTFNGLTAAQFKALLDRYHLKAPARHGSVAISTSRRTLADSKTLRQQYVGSGGFPAPGIGQLRERPGDRDRDERARPPVGAQRDREVLRPQPPGRVPHDLSRTR